MEVQPKPTGFSEQRIARMIELEDKRRAEDIAYWRTATEKERSQTLDQLLMLTSEIENFQDSEPPSRKK